MQSPFKNMQAGTSLIELMMGLGMLTIVALGASMFFKRVSTSDLEARAKAGTISEISLFLSTVERDFKLRNVSLGTPTAPCVSLCKSFSIDRMVRTTLGEEAVMPVKFETICATSSRPEITDIFKSGNNKIKFAPNAETQSTLNGRCLKLGLNGCATGQYPQVLITPAYPSDIDPTTMPIYPRMSKSATGGSSAKLPDLNLKGGLASNVIGAALCAESSGTSKTDRVILEAAYVTAEGFVRVEKREVSIPRRNIANIQMLPSK